MLKTIRIDPRRHRFVKTIHFSETGEPIYAAMVTGKDISRVAMARIAILTFMAQTYPNRYLIIINDGNYCFDVRGVPPGRIIQIQLKGRHSLGELRNQAFASIPAHGIMIQWDDDDWHDPRLMAQQYHVLRTAGVDGCALGRQVKYVIGMNSAWEHVLPADFNGFAGTIMVRNKPDIRYPAWPRNEDTSFWGQFLAKYPTRRWENPAKYYIRLIHATSTSQHFKLWEKTPDDWIVSPETDRYLRRVLALYKISQSQVKRRKRNRAATEIVGP